MMTVRRPLSMVGAAMLAVSAMGLFAGPPASAHGMECHGTVVVVDFGDAGAEAEGQSAETGDGAEPVVACAEDDPGSGLEALTQAGFAVDEVTSIPGLVCRINLRPDTECGSAPPGDEFWSYWHAEAADTEWTYSNTGAATYEPGEGDIEGWSFGDRAEPGIAPDAAVPAETGSEASPTSSWTWVIGLILVSATAGLVIWRIRADRRA